MTNPPEVRRPDCLPHKSGWNLLTVQQTMVAGDCLPFELFDYGNISDWPLDNNWPIDVYRQFL